MEWEEGVQTCSDFAMAVRSSCIVMCSVCGSAKHRVPSGSAHSASALLSSGSGNGLHCRCNVDVGLTRLE